MDALHIIGWIVVLLVTLRYIYWYLTCTFDYWEKKGVRFLPPRIFVGSVLQLYRQDAHLQGVEGVAKYGRVFGYFEGRTPALIVSDPDLIRNILVKDFQYFPSRREFSGGDNISDKMVGLLKGEQWKRVRTIITPTFSTGKIKRTTAIFMDSADTVCKNIEKCINQKMDMNAKRIFGAFTMDVIASSAFGTKIDSYNDPDNKFVVHARKVFQQKFPIRLVLVFLFPKIFKWLGMSVFNPSALAFFKEVTLKIIEERKRTGEVRNDFLQLLLDARMEEGDKEAQDENEHKPDFKRLSQDELLAQCIVFFLAGFESTSSTLCFACYNLALNPDCQEKLIKEIDDMLVENKGEMTYEGIQSLKYLDNVVSETLRLYPVAFGTERTADEDYELGDTGITIPKGMLVGIPVYAMHHDPEFFPDPEKFDPDRFSAENKASRHQYVYLPFGGGPRNCVGMRFALMEVKMCLAKVFSRYKVKKGPNTQVPLQFKNTGGLLMPAEILLTVEKRTDIP